MKISIISTTHEHERDGRPRFPMLEHFLRRVKAAGAKHPDHELLVGCDGDLRASRRAVEEAGGKFFAFPQRGVYSGGPQRNGVMPSATGDLLWFVDDDDWPTEDALVTISAVAEAVKAKTPQGKDWARLLLFRMRYRNGDVLWRDEQADELLRGVRTWRGHLGTPMVVFPRRWHLLGRWGDQNYSDAEMFESTAAKGWPWPPLWTPTVIANARRQDDRDPWT